MVLIKGLQKTSLVDYDGHVCATVFLAGCPLRCKFCHNPTLVHQHYKLPTISEEEFFSFLESRKGWLDAVCVTGGEPTIQPDLIEFMQKIKDKGFKVKLDTMGINPDVVEKALPVVDYIAMDIKAPYDSYCEIVQRQMDVSRVKKSIELIRNSGIDYEFRTTVVPGLHTVADVVMIAQSISGCKKYVLQNFKPGNNMTEEYSHVPGFEQKVLDEMEAKIKEIVPVSVRN